MSTKIYEALHVITAEYAVITGVDTYMLSDPMNPTDIAEKAEKRFIELCKEIGAKFVDEDDEQDAIDEGFFECNGGTVNLVSSNQIIYSSR